MQHNEARPQAHTAQHPPRDAFQAGYAAGQKFGQAAAPYIILTVVIVCALLGFRLLRAIWRWTA
jgi:hypothetical protein